MHLIISKQKSTGIEIPVRPMCESRRSEIIIDAVIVKCSENKMFFVQAILQSDAVCYLHN